MSNMEKIGTIEIYRNENELFGPHVQFEVRSPQNVVETIIIPLSTLSRMWEPEVSALSSLKKPLIRILDQTIESYEQEKQKNEESLRLS